MFNVNVCAYCLLVPLITKTKWQENAHVAYRKSKKRPSRVLAQSQYFAQENFKKCEKIAHLRNLAHPPYFAHPEMISSFELSPIFQWRFLLELIV